MPTHHRLANRLGFTLIEVIISVGILTFLAGSGIIFMTKFLGQSNLRSEHTLVLSLMKEARSLSLGNRDGKPHGVKILNETYVIFEGWTYAGRNATYDIPYNRDTNVIITGPDEIMFYNLSGKSAGALLTFIHPSTTTKYTINANTEGSIDW